MENGKGPIRQLDIKKERPNDNYKVFVFPLYYGTLMWCFNTTPLMNDNDVYKNDMINSVSLSLHMILIL